MDCEAMRVSMQHVRKSIESMSSTKSTDRQRKPHNDDQRWWVAKSLSYPNNWRCNEYRCRNLAQVRIASLTGKGQVSRWRAWSYCGVQC
jgi:hypothetical protein